MTVIKRSATVPYTTTEMYDLVNHVEAYPEFLPWCSGCDVLSRSDDEVRATLHVAKAGIEKSFTTCNRLQRNKMIEIRLLDGPFAHLHGFWHFEEVADGLSRVAVNLEFEMVGGFMDRLFGPVFTQVSASLVQAFCQRAVVVYGYRELLRD